MSENSTEFAVLAKQESCTEAERQWDINVWIDCKDLLRVAVGPDR